MRALDIHVGTCKHHSFFLIKIFIHDPTVFNPRLFCVILQAVESYSHKENYIAVYCTNDNLNVTTNLTTAVPFCDCTQFCKENTSFLEPDYNSICS